jgi:hypothetical protein
MRYYFLDNNIFNFAVTGAGGAVIEELNRSIAKFPELEQPDTAFCMTPFTLLEALGTRLPEISVKPIWPKDKTTRDVVSDVVARAKQSYLALPELTQTAIVQRIQERRSFIPVECHDLFNHCVTNPGSRVETPVEIANVLAWDYALKIQYPKDKRDEIRTFFMTIIVAARAAPLISRFRIVKRLWDEFFKMRTLHAASAKEGIEAANRAMRLKTTRDFVDCDLLHLACFGWGDHDVVAFTCDPPAAICKRVSVYKGIVALARDWADQIDPAQLPQLRDGRIAFCEPDGNITQLVRISDLPTII